jgi:hypothetical protein
VSTRQLNPSEIATVVRSKKILGKIGLGSAINISKVCDKLSISRKTAYEYDKPVDPKDSSKEETSSSEELVEEVRVLKKRLKDVELENQGLRIAKKIFDEFKKK